MDNIFPKQFKFWYPGNILKQSDEVSANHQTFHELDGVGGGKWKENKNKNCLPAAGRKEQYVLGRGGKRVEWITQFFLEPRDWLQTVQGEES